MYIIVRKDVIDMKMLVLICAVLFLPAQAESSPPESILHKYVAADGEIKAYVQNMYLQMHLVHKTANEFVTYMEQNITLLRENYGEPMFQHYGRKFVRTADEFEHRKGLSEECLSLVAGLLMDNLQMQDRLSDSIVESLTYWKTGYRRLNKVISDTRIALVNLEKEAYECADQFDVSDDEKLTDCAEKVLNKSWTLNFDRSHEIKDELTSLGKRTEESLEKLYERLHRKGILTFYHNEEVINSWLKIYCLEQSQNITDAS